MKNRVHQAEAFNRYTCNDKWFGNQSGRRRCRAVRVSWQKDGSGGLSLRDELMMVSEGEGVYSEIIDTGLLRGHLGGSFELPELSASASHLYLFFGSKDRRSYSGSECFAMN